MNCIRTSLFDIYRIGPGPSSSHTIGPMRAGGDFLARWGARPVPDGAALEAHFHGSLASTGKGHGSDRAAAAGLLGERPETCDTDRLLRLLAPGREPPAAKFGGRRLPLEPRRFFFHREPHDFPHANTMRFRLVDASGALLAEEVYYSLGGGEIARAGDDPPSAEPLPPYRFRDWNTFAALPARLGVAPADVLIANETHRSGLDGDGVSAELQRRLDLMLDAVERGLPRTGTLPGSLRLARRAQTVAAARDAARDPGERLLLSLDAYALAAAEENAAGARVVTAPTSGASGVLPGLLRWLKRDRNVPDAELRRGLVLAAAVGMVAKHNAGISGAEMGCQGEIGVASAMGAALLAAVAGLGLDVVEAAAEIALEHHLGLICDPVDGLVQIPCVERNAAAAVAAYNAFLLARSRAGGGRVRFDEVVSAMREAGAKMSREFKETASGGLAACALCM